MEEKPLDQSTIEEIAQRLVKTYNTPGNLFIRAFTRR